MTASCSTVPLQNSETGWVDSWLSGVVTEIRLLKFTPDWRTAGVWLTWTVLVIRTEISDLLFFLLSLDHRWSIVQSMGRTTEGGECLVWIFFASCFLLVETIFSAHQRRFAVSEGEKSGLGSNEQVSYRSWARLYCISTRLDRSPLANICPRWKPSPCTCKKLVACELNGWHWRFNTQSLIENRMQSSSILIGRGTQKTHQMKVPYMMK